MPVPENTIFYFDLATKNVVSKKTIVKQVNKYIKLREKESPESNWGTVIFQYGEDNPAFHERLAEDEEGLEPFLQNNLEFTDKSHPIEQGLMLASTYLIESYRDATSHVLRVIVISDGPSEGSNIDLLNALMDLLDNIKYFVFIDIIRVGDERVYPDDIKLKLITDLTRGAVYYADSDDSFKNIMDNLVNQEQTLNNDMQFIIPEEKRPFFENICWKLVDKGFTDVACVACTKEHDENDGQILQCEKCGALYHVTCAKEFEQREPGPLTGMFRCKSCHCLLLAIENVSGVQAMACEPSSEVESITYSSSEPGNKKFPGSPDNKDVGGNFKLEEEENNSLPTTETRDAEAYANMGPESVAELEQSLLKAITEMPEKSALRAVRSTLSRIKPSANIQQAEEDDIKVISVECITQGSVNNNYDGKIIIVQDDDDEVMDSRSYNEKKE
ncbi:MAG TPA: PHD finger domain-containing protein [Candidatus Lokiarchaeia archaeon]|nr:PHD finger domain-containing protein [Candidatus Lokiarchaeia archaeon]